MLQEASRCGSCLNLRQSCAGKTSSVNDIKQDAWQNVAAVSAHRGCGGLQFSENEDFGVYPTSLVRFPSLIIMPAGCNCAASLLPPKERKPSAKDLALH